jgi:hypothetical protein
MTRRNEHTSARVLKIAARALRTKGIWVCYSGQERGDFVHISDAEFRACMASLVNQAPRKTSRTKSHRGKGAKKLGKWVQWRPLKRKARGK